MNESSRKGEVRKEVLEHEVKVINLSNDRVRVLREDLLKQGAKETFSGVIENVRVDTEDRVLKDAGINARIRKYVTLRPDGTENVMYEWTVKRKVTRSKFKSRRELKGDFVATFSDAMASLTAYVSNVLKKNVHGLKELWTVKKHRDMYAFSEGHDLAGTEVVIDKLIDVSIGGSSLKGNVPTNSVPHFMEIESSTGNDDTDDFNISESGSRLGVDIGGTLHDASEREFLEYYGFLKEERKKKVA